jgi:ferredoxin
MSKIHLEKEKCVQCGACAAVCNSNALFLETRLWTLVYDEKKCVGCCLCIKACPSRAIKAEKRIEIQPSVTAESLK